MALPATDDFNRANGAVGANWTATKNGFNVNTNMVKGATFAYNAVAWTADTFNSDHYSQCTAVSVISDGGPGVRIQAGPKSYHYDLKGSNTCKIQKDVNGTFTDLVINIATPANGDTVYIEASGSTITVKTNGVQKGTTTDSTITGGSPGLWDYDTQANYDNFQGDNLAGAAPAPWPLLLPGPVRVRVI